MYSTGMDDVTRKVAYAYAKQQTFVALAIALLGLGGVFLAYPWPSRLLATLFYVASASLWVGGASILAFLLAHRDLGSVNRFSLRLTTAVLGVELLLLVVAGAWGRPSAPALATGFGLLLTLAIAVVGYPFPLARGGPVLYGPNAVRELSDGRTLGLAAVGFICFSLAQLLLQGWPGTAGPATSGPLGSGLVVLLLLVLGGAATALFVTLPVGRRLPRVLMGPVAAGVVVGLVATGEFSPTSEFGLWALAVAVWGAVALLVVMVLSPGLNRGRTLVGHRA